MSDGQRSYHFPFVDDALLAMEREGMRARCYEWRQKGLVALRWIGSAWVEHPHRPSRLLISQCFVDLNTDVRQMLYEEISAEIHPASLPALIPFLCSGLHRLWMKTK